MLAMYRWGLIPSWAKDPAIGNKMINARAETVRQKPAFRSAFERRRCLVPVSGLFDWQKAGKSKIPHWIHPADGGLLTFAGLWERWSPEDAEPVYSYTILTTGANTFAQRLHDRIPVIVPSEERDRWLDSAAKPDQVADLLSPAPAGVLHAHAVSTLVNVPGNEPPECIQPFQAA